MRAAISVRAPGNGEADLGDGAQARPQYLASKLRVPRPTFPVLRRPRVLGLLDQAARHRVSLVCAPAGAGKTTACASWAAAARGTRQVAWLTVDAEDQRDWFWASVCAAITRQRVAPGDDLHHLADVPADQFPLRLIEAAHRFAEPLVLILDNAHEITDPAVLQGLDVLIRHAPPALRLVLSARQPPPLQLARLRVAGELADIDGGALACTAEEADGYFAMLGIELGAAERAELLRRTEGWMTGLRLAAMRDGDGAGGPVPGREFTGHEPDVTDYLWDEVLSRQPPQTLGFLIRTSVTDRIGGDLADALTGGSGGARTLEELSRANAFVEPVSRRQGEYRYHPLLRDALTAELRRRHPDQVPHLLRQAARWYAANDQMLAAVSSAAAAPDWDFAAQALADAGPAALMPAGVAGLEGLLSQFPADRAAGDPTVPAVWAAARLWDGDAEGAAGYLDTAQRALAGSQARIRPGVAAAVTAVRVLQAAACGSLAPDLPEKARLLAERAGPGPVSRAEHRGLGLLWYAIGVTVLRRWQLPEACDALRQADRQFGAGALAGFRARAAGWRAVAEAWQGELSAAQRSADEALAAAAARPWPGLGAGPGEPSQRMLAGQAERLAALAQAQVSLSRDDLAAARRQLTQAAGRRAGELPGEPSVGVLAALTGARIQLADGDAAAARAALARLRELPDAVDDALSDVITLTEAEAALRAGDTGRARALLLLADAGGDGAGPAAALVRGRLLLAESDFQGARSAVQPWLDSAGPRPAALPDRIWALLVAAAADRRLGDTAGAAQLLEQALALAEPETAFRIFLDGGPAIRSAVTVLIPPTSRNSGFAGRILERFEAQGAPPAARADGASVRLTDCERAVLSFLPSHMTNEEISDALFISVNTVKTHLRSTYRKLGVGSRREAIACGRRLGVLLRALAGHAA